MNETGTFTAFAGQHIVATGRIEDVATALTSKGDPSGSVLIFDDANGSLVELDLRHGPEHAVAEYRARTAPTEVSPSRPGRGRPKLGVVAREITLLPRHWDWLAAQSGGASAALRRLVDDARRAGDGPQRERHAREAAYRVMSALAGDLPGFEEASRALFAGDLGRLESLGADWPADIRGFVLHIVAPA